MKKTLEKKEDRNNEPSLLPLIDNFVKVNTGGSSINGVSYFSAKRHAREMTPQITLSSWAKEAHTNLVIGFSKNQSVDFLIPHHDTMVLSLQVANFMVQRVLVDNRSLANILFSAAMKEINILEITFNGLGECPDSQFSEKQKFILDEL